MPRIIRLQLTKTCANIRFFLLMYTWFSNLVNNSALLYRWIREFLKSSHCSALEKADCLNHLKLDCFSFQLTEYQSSTFKILCFYLAVWFFFLIRSVYKIANCWFCEVRLCTYIALYICAYSSNLQLLQFSIYIKSFCSLQFSFDLGFQQGTPKSWSLYYFSLSVSLSIVT